MGWKPMNRDEAARLFQEHAVLMAGGSDGIPEYIARELFAEDALAFAFRACFAGEMWNASTYGIDGMIKYLTRCGFMHMVAWMNVVALWESQKYK